MTPSTSTISTAIDIATLPPARTKQLRTFSSCESIPYCDHVGGFAGIVRAFGVDEIFDSGQQYGGRTFNDGMHEASIRHVPVHIARCGDRRTSADGVDLSILSPC